MTAGPDVLRVAESLIRDNPDTPGLPADLAVHAAILLADEKPRYIRMSYREGMADTLLFTAVTRTRVLQLTAATTGRDEGVGIDADVRELTWSAA